MIRRLDRMTPSKDFIIPRVDQITPSVIAYITGLVLPVIGGVTGAMTSQKD